MDMKTRLLRLHQQRDHANRLATLDPRTDAELQEQAEREQAEEDALARTPRGRYKIAMTDARAAMADTDLAMGRIRVLGEPCRANFARVCDARYSAEQAALQVLAALQRATAACDDLQRDDSVQAAHDLAAMCNGPR